MDARHPGRMSAKEETYIKDVIYPGFASNLRQGRTAVALPHVAQFVQAKS
jgi:hypothetical protein